MPDESPPGADAVAAIDCGTNSLRLLIARRGPGGDLVDVVRRTRIVRLGEDVDATGRLAPRAIARTAEVLRVYADLLAEHRVRAARMVATSAVRDAGNRADFTAAVRATIGLTPEVITGDREAQLTFVGATATRRGAVDVLVVDIGGGSTELVLGRPGAAPAAMASMQVGSVRLTERHLRGDPPAADEVRDAEAAIADALDDARQQVPVERADALVAVAGTALTVATIALGLPDYDSAVVDGAWLSADAVADVTARLLRMTVAERLRLGAVTPGRADVIGAGAMLLRAVIRAAEVDGVVVSEHDLLDGIVRELV